MTDSGNWRGRGLMLSASTAAILALAAGSAAQADCEAEIAALEREIQHAEAFLESEEEQRQQTMAQPDQQPAPGDQQQAMEQPDQQPAPGDQQQTMAQPDQQPAPGEQQQAAPGSEEPSELEIRQRQAMAEPHQPGETADQQQPSSGEMQTVRPPAGATMGQPAEQPQPGEAEAQDQQTAMADQEVPANHPLVLQMADGSVVDMRPPEEREADPVQAADQPATGQESDTEQQQAAAQPAEPPAADQDETAAADQEVEGVPEPLQPAVTHGPELAEPLWFSDEQTVEVVETGLEQAKLALQQGNEQACLEAIQEARASIEEYNMRDHDGQGALPPGSADTGGPEQR
jgi:hypothetical protein